MRHVTFTLLAFFLTSNPGRSEASDAASALYNEGNALYRQGAYEAAIDRYQDVVGSGIRNPDVYYNLGNAYFKAGALGQALLNYERARRLAPSDPDISGNVAFANTLKVDRFDIDAPNAVTRFLTAIYTRLSPNGLAAWVSFSFLGICFGLAGLLFLPGRRVRWFVVLGVASLGCVLSIALLTVKVDELNTPKGIVLVPETVGRSGPSSDYLQVFTLHEGTLVVLERQEGQWGLIRLPNGIGGWIQLETFGMI